MKIIFLDIDGVLNVNRPERDDYGSLFHDEFVENLRKIIDATGAKIVISSTWRMSGYKIMKEMWASRKLPGKIFDITPYHISRHRGQEIQDWIDCSDEFHEGIDRYVILDDDTDMMPHQIPYYVQTFDGDNFNTGVEGYGLTDECANKAIKILNG